MYCFRGMPSTLYLGCKHCGEPPCCLMTILLVGNERNSFGLDTIFIRLYSAIEINIIFEAKFEALRYLITGLTKNAFLKYVCKSFL